MSEKKQLPKPTSGGVWVRDAKSGDIEHKDGPVKRRKEQRAKEEKAKADAAKKAASAKPSASSPAASAAPIKPSDGGEA